jgi:UPF0755 protein
MEPLIPQHSSATKPMIFLGGGIIFIFLFYFFLITAPRVFPVGKIESVEEGTGLRMLSLQLKKDHIIRSRTIFEAFMILYGGEKHVIPADYLLDSKTPVFEIARRIAKGERHLAPVKLTIPEGFTVKEIAETASLRLLKFNKDKFLKEALKEEGYLFPDTYFFFTNDDEQNVLAAMKDNFAKKITPLQGEINASGKTEKDIVIMASLIEGEAKGDKDREFISGILWHRISIGMALQVDAAPETYKKRGLPLSPIGNPGLLSIEASIHPKTSPYLYYLHDRDGFIHYARTFSEHTQNIKKYLK